MSEQSQDSQIGQVVESMKQQVEQLSSLLANVELEENELRGQEVDPKVVEFYINRFKMFAEDGCPRAIDAYLQHMLADKSINDITRIRIGMEALKF